MIKQSFFETFALIRSDMQFRCDYEHKALTHLQILVFLLNHSVMSQILFRFQGFFYTHHLKIIASFIESLNSLIFTVRIHSTTQIDRGLILLHANYINIGRNVTIGKNCILAQQNAIGPAFTSDTNYFDQGKGPVIGDGVLLGVGSSVFGNITIGSRSTIGINSSVDKSFPENSILVGVPAKNLNLG